MTREEAIKIIKANCSCSDSKLREACALFIPELKESEDEKARKGIIEFIYSKLDSGEMSHHDRNHVKSWLAYLEKQKEASKAMEAVDRIDKYIDKHLANAHDMKDSNPDKKYYRGWDDALGEMAGILQDVYSDEKQKEQKPADEQFPPLEGLDAIKAKYYDDGFKNGFDEGVASVKPAEWSEEDKKMIECCVKALLYYKTHAKREGFFPAQFNIEGYLTSPEMVIDWINKSLRPQPKEEGCDYW